MVGTDSVISEDGVINLCIYVAEYSYILRQNSAEEWTRFVFFFRRWEWVSPSYFERALVFLATQWIVTEWQGFPCWTFV